MFTHKTYRANHPASPAEARLVFLAQDVPEQTPPPERPTDGESENWGVEATPEDIARMEREAAVAKTEDTLKAVPPASGTLRVAVRTGNQSLELRVEPRSTIDDEQKINQVTLEVLKKEIPIIFNTLRSSEGWNAKYQEIKDATHSPLATLTRQLARLSPDERNSVLEAAERAFVDTLKISASPADLHEKFESMFMEDTLHITPAPKRLKGHVELLSAILSETLRTESFKEKLRGALDAASTNQPGDSEPSSTKSTASAGTDRKEITNETDTQKFVVKGVQTKENSSDGEKSAPTPTATPRPQSSQDRQGKEPTSSERPDPNTPDAAFKLVKQQLLDITGTLKNQSEWKAARDEVAKDPSSSPNTKRVFAELDALSPEDRNKIIDAYQKAIAITLNNSNSSEEFTRNISEIDKALKTGGVPAGLTPEEAKLLVANRSILHGISSPTTTDTKSPEAAKDPEPDTPPKGAEKSAGDGKWNSAGEDGWEAKKVDGKIYARKTDKNNNLMYREYSDGKWKGLDYDPLLALIKKEETDKVGSIPDSVDGGVTWYPRDTITNGLPGWQYAKISNGEVYVKKTDRPTRKYIPEQTRWEDATAEEITMLNDMGAEIPVSETKQGKAPDKPKDAAKPSAPAKPTEKTAAATPPNTEAAKKAGGETAQAAKEAATKVPSTNKEQLQQRLDEAIATLKKKDVKPAEALGAFVKVISVVVEMMKRTFDGTLDQPIAIKQQPAAEAAKGKPAAADAKTTAREAVEKDLEKKEATTPVQQKEALSKISKESKDKIAQNEKTITNIDVDIQKGTKGKEALDAEVKAVEKALVDIGDKNSPEAQRLQITLDGLKKQSAAIQATIDSQQALKKQLQTENVALATKAEVADKVQTSMGFISEQIGKAAKTLGEFLHANIEFRQNNGEQTLAVSNLTDQTPEWMKTLLQGGRANIASLWRQFPFLETVLPAATTIPAIAVKKGTQIGQYIINLPAQVLTLLRR